MKILAFSDWRTQPFEMLIDVVTAHKPDLILYAGDDLNRLVGFNGSIALKTTNIFMEFNYPILKPVSNTQEEILTTPLKEYLAELIQKRFESVGILQKLGIPSYYVNGNDDIILHANNSYYTRIHNRHFYIDNSFYVLAERKGRITIKKEDIPDHLKSYMLEEIALNNNYEPFQAGIYIPIKPSFGDFTFQNKKEEVNIFGCECEFGLENNIKNNPKEYADIYLSHIPPLGTLDLSVRFGMKHIGSKGLLDAIKKYHPKVVICGHSHIWGGNSRKIGETLVVNVSSHDRPSSPGNYALIDTEDWSIEMKLIKYKTTCHTRGLSAFIYGIRSKCDKTENDNLSEKIVLWKNNQLTHEEESETLEKIETFGISTKKVKERIESLQWDNPKITKKITINPEKQAFVDVETGIFKGFNEPGKLWLIGLYYKGEFKQFKYPNQRKAFLKYINDNQIKSLASWTGYDKKVLKPILKRANIDIEFIDACQRTANCVTWHNYQLHELYNTFFPEKYDEDQIISGYVAGLYADHLIIPNKSCPYCPPKEEVIEKIKKRNLQDLHQMVEICSKLCQPKIKSISCQPKT